MLPRLQLWLCALFLLSFFSLQAGALPEPTAVLRLRQDDRPSSSPPPPQPSSTDRDQPPRSTSGSTDRPTDSSVTASSTASDRKASDSSSSGTTSPTDTPSSTTLDTSTKLRPTSTVTDIPTPSDPPPSKDASNPLPIVPTITPALGVAGIILIIFGGALTFIGVRSKWLFIFESTAFLVALAIVVLLVYVADSSTSNAIQGAYFVAAFVPACIIGGLSLIFKDLVEGLGCLLGGFCLAMWFLVLKDGGLISSSGGRTGFIVGLAAAGFSLSFSRYTRAYGLIACLSFAGATALILGVDCYSRVGLKEFWLYIWNLNPNTFPLGTSTYPVTRGIKVEIACIIILAVFGVMSQMKLWKIIREKRQKRAAARAQDQEDREHLEADLGRQLEDRNHKELKQWEATYGSKGADASVSAFTTTEGSMHDSSYHSNPPSVKKMSISVKESGNEYVEMTDMSGTARSQGKAVNRRGSRDGPTINVFEDNATTSEAPQGRHSNSEALRALETVTEGDSPGPSRPMSYVVKGDDDEGHWAPKAAPGPVVQPLPFVVPSAEKPKAQDDDVKSTATAGEDVRDPDEAQPAPFPRQSLPRTTNKRTSGAVSVRDDEDDQMSFIIPHNDDARSSLAATVDGLSEDGHSDLPDLSRGGTPLPFNDKQAESEPYTLRKVHSASSLKDTAPMLEGTTAKPEDANRRHSVQIGQLEPQSTLGSLSNLAGTKDLSDKSSETTAKLKRLSEDSKANGARSRTVSQPAGLTKDALPEGQSSTVLLYRTNEWAKHQAVAEALHPDEVAPPSEGGVSVAYGAEASAPVDIAALQHTAFTQQAPSISREPSQIASNNPYKKHSHVKRNSGDERELLSRQNSATSLTRNASQASVNRPSLARAASSAGMSPTSPYGAPTILESPAEEMPTRSSQNLAQIRSSTAMSSTNTLIGRRQSMLNGRMSSMSFASPDAPTHSMVGLQQIAEQPLGPSDSASSLGLADDNASLASRRKQLVNEEDMTLAQRKQALKQGQGRMQRSPSAMASTNPYRAYTPQPQLQRSVSQQYASPSNQMMASNPRLIYDSHQPQRGATVTAATRESRLASWRASVAQDGTVGGQTAATTNQTALMNESRARIIDEQRRAGEAKMAKELEKNRRESQIDLRMRSGDMVALHREKMRKLQRQASQHQ